MFTGFPEHWTTLKKLMFAVGSGIAGAAAGVWKTVTGALIHITDALASPMQKCEVTLEPIQDLHGQDSPYPAGGGANLLDIGSKVSKTVAGVTYTSDENYITLNGTKSGYTYAEMQELSISLQAGTYYAKAFPINGEVLCSIYMYNGSDLTNNIIGTERTFTLAEAGNVWLRFALWTDGAVFNNYKLGIVLSKSTISEWSPYSNICPITGVSGKNLCDPSQRTKYDNTIYDWYADDGFLLEAGTSYALSSNLNNGTVYIYRYSDNEVLSYGVSTVYTPDSDVLCYFSYENTGGASADIALQLEKNSSVTAFSQYFKCEVTRTGKNLLEPKFYNGGAYNGDVGRQFTFTEDTSVVKTGNVYSKSVGGWGHVTLVSSLLKVGMYKINIAISAPSVRSTLYVFDKDFRVLFKANSTNPQTWSYTLGLHEDGYIAVYLASSTEGTVTFTEPQIEIGETFTGYEEYQGTTLSVTFPDSAGTVYGGTVDLVSGVLTVDYGEVDLGSLSWLYSSGATRFYINILSSDLNIKYPTDPSKALSGLCEELSVAPWATVTTNNINNAIAVKNDGTEFNVRCTKYTDAASFKTAMSGVQLVYELAEPIEIQLTPQEISTLAGENNVWSNFNGETTIIYKAKAE